MKRELKLNFGQLRQVEEKVEALEDILGQLDDLLAGYINDMEGYIVPKDENRMMLLERNDIWWNMKQIRANLVEFLKNIYKY